MYVCGITPYDASHLGHAFVFLFFDTLIRFLKFQGFKVTYVQNITDVDDDILKRARQTGEDWQALGNRWVADLLSDFEFLNIQKPDHMPRASEVIEEILTIDKDLLQKKLAYEVEGNVYFSVNAFNKYGALSRLSRDQMIKISAIRGNDIKDPRKKDPLDFVLWQKSRPESDHPLGEKPTEPSWESPWGSGRPIRQAQGRPGWHIECSAMSMKFLGEQIDIHGGGADLIFPHHESEIAQSENFTGKAPFVKYWLHCGMVLYEAEKMSKSLGNLIFIKDLRKKYSANAIRWYLLSNHYRRPWEYMEDDLLQIQEMVNKIEKDLSAHNSNPPSSPFPLDSFSDVLSNDFNTPEALEIVKKTEDHKKQYAMWRILGFK